MYGRLFVVGYAVSKSYYATDRDELAKNTAAIEELEDLGKRLADGCLKREENSNYEKT